MKRRISKRIVSLVLWLRMIISNSITAFATEGEGTVETIVSVERTEPLAAGIPTVVLAILIVAIVTLAILGTVFGLRFLKKKLDDYYYFDEEDEELEEIVQ